MAADNNTSLVVYPSSKVWVKIIPVSLVATAQPFFSLQYKPNWWKHWKQPASLFICQLMTGGAITTPWESENVLHHHAWYGSNRWYCYYDVLFGDYNLHEDYWLHFIKAIAIFGLQRAIQWRNRTYRYFLVNHFIHLDMDWVIQR